VDTAVQYSVVEFGLCWSFSTVVSAVKTVVRHLHVFFHLCTYHYSLDSYKTGKFCRGPMQLNFDSLSVVFSQMRMSLLTLSVGSEKLGLHCAVIE
jgi:hypothetical protein